MLTMAPRYENTTAILEMTGALDGVPHFHLAMDHDWDEAARVAPSFVLVLFVLKINAKETLHLEVRGLPVCG